MKIFQFQEFAIYVGNNAEENHRLVTESNEYDIWLHLENHPSPHVIIVNNMSKKEKTIKNRKLIKRAACLCKSHSKLKKEKDVPIIYTFCKNIEPCDKTGSVNVNESKCIKI